MNHDALFPDRQPLTALIVTLSLCFFVSSSLFASVWTSTGPDTTYGVDRELANVTVGPDGVITLAPALVERHELDESSVWDIAGLSGRLFLATGNSGRLYRLDRGQPEPVFDAGAGQLLGLGTGPSDVFFGTTPDGAVYRASAAGPAAKLCETGESYVFAVATGPAGELYCATGTNGRLLRVSGSGRCDTVFAAPQAHITSLAWLVPGKVLLAGTSPDGIIYRLELRAADRPQVTVLYDSPLDEVRAIACADARVYAAANPGANSEGGPAVFCLEPDGILEWQWPMPDSGIYDILPDRRGLLVATGDNGLLFRVDSMGRGALIQNAGPARLLCLARAGDRVLLGTGTPARVLELTAGLADSGAYLSPVFDCGTPARFGRIDWRGSAPNGTSLALDTRTGNSEEPDSTWSQWLPAPGQVKSPPARFVQWRARLATRFPTITPALERVDIYYTVPNRPPLVKKLALAQVELPDAAKGSAQPTRELSWQVEDPDSDSLGYELWYRREEDDRWLRLARDLSGASLLLDTRTLPDGWCRFRLLATDKPARPAGTALAVEYLSAPALIDNTPPEAKAEVTGSTLKVTVTDRTSTIAACRYSLNGGTWQPLGPDDGLLDSATERFSAELLLEPGLNSISTWSSDASGNAATHALSITR